MKYEYRATTTGWFKDDWRGGSALNSLRELMDLDPEIKLVVVTYENGGVIEQRRVDHGRRV